MITLAGYEVSDALPSGDQTRVFRGRRISDGRAVVLKLASLADPYGRRTDLGHEYELLRSLEIRGIPRALALESYQGQPVLVLEDTGTQPLREVCARGAMAIAPFLALAIQLVEILAQLHEAGVIHKDINPSNILYDPRSGRVDLIDFGIASRLPRETASYHTPNLLEGTLPYLSPEQTGRMNRVVDYRSDFYALGMTFYELVTGRLAFASEDPLELCHSHIAKLPVAPNAVKPSVPSAVSQIVMKLVSKMAEQRYQSAYGLLVDLRACQDGRGGLDGFIAGARDVSRALSVPQKLYGRDAEVEALLRAFDRVALGGLELVTVGGYSGIGKSSLIHEVYRPIVRSGGYFISGKFDQYRRDVPYDAFAQAIRQLCRELLLEGEERFPDWQQRFAETLGGSAAVLAEIVAEIELFTGKQPPPHEVGAADAQRRLIRAFQQLVGMFVPLGRPLVMFLDDLQWADAASLTLLQALATSRESRRLMLIGAYRDNEVDPAHPLQLTWNAIDQAGIVARRALRVLPLGLGHIEELLADTFGVSRSSRHRLASLLAAKTGGNPFFLGQMLVSLHHQRLIEFDPLAGEWRWDAERIATAAIADNVVDLMLGELRRVPAAAQRLLQRAACIGNRFELGMLATLDSVAPEAAAQSLWDALVAGFIVPEDDGYRQVTATAGAPAGAVWLRFAHDRVQQAAHAMLPEHERAVVHLQIGRMRLVAASAAGRELGSDVFEVFAHFAAARALVVDPGERRAVAVLALAAGTRARASSAYETAVHVLAVGEGLLADDAWQTDYALALAIAMEQGQAEYQSGDFARAEQRFHDIITRARALHERANAYCSLLLLHENAGRFSDALACGTACLQLFGIAISPTMSIEQSGAWMREVITALDGRRIADLVDAPPLRDPDQLALARVLLRMSSIAYFFGPALYTALASRSALVYVKHGTTGSSATVYAYFGATLCAWGEYADGFAFGDLALELRDRGNDDLPGQVTYVHGAWLIGRREHLRVSTEWLRRACQELITAGDFGIAAYAAGLLVGDLFVRGMNLLGLHHEAMRWAGFCEKAQSRQLADVIVSADRACRALIGTTNDPGTYNDAHGFDEAAFERQLASRPPNIRVWWHHHRAVVGYVFGDYAAAQGASNRAQSLVWSIFSQVRVPEHRFYRALIGLAQWPKLASDERDSVVAHATAALGELERLAQPTPTTFAPRARLVAAELARVRGEAAAAAELYDAAIASAIEQDHIQIAAIACECALRFALERKKVSHARGYLLDAIQHYATWGASRKVQQLAERHRMLLPASSTQLTTITRTISRGQGSQGGAGSSPAISLNTGLDLHTATKASQAISSEIRLDRLLEKLTEILIESAGAERGFVMLKTDERLVVEAAFTAAGEVRVLESAEMTSYPGLSAGVIGYVARTGEQVVLDNASRSAFAADPHLATGAVKSVLCLPITHQNKLVGVVYLENNLVEACFTFDRIEVLRILMTQIAISIDHAKLYAGMEAKVRERTADLSERERSLRLILDTTGDGLLSIDLDGRVRGQISAAMIEWFGPIAEGSVLWQVMGPRDEGFRWAFEFGMQQLRDELPFDLVVIQMPRRLERDGVVFELDYKQVPGGEQLTRLLVTVRDVTAEVAAERAGREARERQDIVGWLVVDRDGLRAFVKDAEQLMAQLRETTEPMVARRLIHTLKGNAALYSFATIAEYCHALETELEDAGDALPSAGQLGEIDALFASALRGLGALLELQRTAIELADAEYVELLSMIEARAPHGELLELVQAWRWPKAADQLARLGGQISQVARALGKPVRVSVADHELRLAPQRFDGFLSTLVHVARNAVDHGIESPDDRLRAGKPTDGAISLAMRIERSAMGDELVIEVADDGRGIDTGALASIAARRGVSLRSSRDVVNLLFSDGVSTRAAVSETSGRGVGLAAVKAACEEIGGRVEVSWMPGRGTAFRFCFPASLASAPRSAVAGAGAVKRSTSTRIPTIATLGLPSNPRS